MRRLQNLLVLVALVFVVLILYPFSSSSPNSPNSPTSFQYVGEFGLIAVAIAAALVYYLRPSQKRPGEQVSY